MRKIWTCLEYSIVHHTHLLQDRHLDQLIMCAVYVVCKVCMCKCVLFSLCVFFFFLNKHEIYFFKLFYFALGKMCIKVSNYTCVLCTSCTRCVQEVGMCNFFHNLINIKIYFFFNYFFLFQIKMCVQVSNYTYVLCTSSVRCVLTSCVRFVSAKCTSCVTKKNHEKCLSSMKTSVLTKKKLFNFSFSIIVFMSFVTRKDKKRNIFYKKLHIIFGQAHHVCCVRRVQLKKNIYQV